MTNSSIEDLKSADANKNTAVSNATRRLATPVELFAVRIYDGRILEPNSSYDTDNLDRQTPPPPFPYSRPSTAVSRQQRLPGCAVEDSTVFSNPPPNYVECSIPPPTYDDLYESIEKPRKVFSDKRIKQIIFWVCLGALSIPLLTIGIWSMIFQNCVTLFLAIWNVVTGGLIIICVFIGTCKAFRKILSRRRNLAQTLVYCSAVFTACWLVAGLVASFGEIGEGRCSQEVTDMIIAASIIICAFSLFLCLCGSDIFTGTRTHPT